MHIGPLVLLEWIDSSAPQRRIWHDDVSNLPPLKIRSIGWIVREDKTAIVLASHLHEDEVAGVLIIPKGVVTKRRTIRSKSYGGRRA